MCNIFLQSLNPFYTEMNIKLLPWRSRLAATKMKGAISTVLASCKTYANHCNISLSIGVWFVSSQCLTRVTTVNDVSYQLHTLSAKRGRKIGRKQAVSYAN